MSGVSTDGADSSVTALRAVRRFELEVASASTGPPNLFPGRFPVLQGSPFGHLLDHAGLLARGFPNQEYLAVSSR